MAGIRTPQNITENARIIAGSNNPSLEKIMPEAFLSYVRSRRNLSSIIEICRILNLPLKRVNYGCCRPVQKTHSSCSSQDGN